MRMRAAAHHHTGVVGELATLWAAMSSVVDLVLGLSPDETSWVEVMRELTVKIRRPDDFSLQLEGPSMRIYSLLLRPLSGRAQWADRLEEVAG
jgi:hypothetical protein